MGRPRRLRGREHAEELAVINRRRSELRGVGDVELTNAARRPGLVRADAFALACEAARRTLGLDVFDVQVLGGLVMADGQIAEMQTGEGKTLAATLPVCWAALGGQPVHVLTANEYLARRDAQWMGPVYRLLGLSVGWVDQAADLAARKAAYACDVTYGSATEVGFDFLRDQQRRRPEDLVQRPFGLALVDEVDSILIDEARIPLVIAGGDGAPAQMARLADTVAPRLARGVDYECAGGERRVVLTEHGAAKAEALLGCGNLFEPANGGLLAALVQALHAHALLARDVDYIVRDGRVALVDENKGRVAELRRWPEGLQAAVEAKEGLEVQHAGRILGSITLQSFIALYPRVCGMTGTAATQATEFQEIYGLEVVVVPTNRPARPPRPAGRRVGDPGREARRPARPHPRGARAGEAGARGHGERRGVGGARPQARGRGHPAPRAERPQRGGRGGGDQAGGAPGRRHDLDQHGGPRHGHPAGRRSAAGARACRGARRPARARHEPPREPAHRPPAAGARRPPGRSGRVGVPRLARGRSLPALRPRSRGRPRPRAARDRGPAPRDPPEPAALRAHPRAAAADRARAAARGAAGRGREPRRAGAAGALRGAGARAGRGRARAGSSATSRSRRSTRSGASTWRRPDRRGRTWPGSR